MRTVMTSNNADDSILLVDDTETVVSRWRVDREVIAKYLRYGNKADEWKTGEWPSGFDPDIQNDTQFSGYLRTISAYGREVGRDGAIDDENINLFWSEKNAMSHEATAAYRMSDGTIVKTSNATHSWNETTYEGTSISCASGTQFDHQTLYRSKKGRYYVVRKSQPLWTPAGGGVVAAATQRAEWISNEEACRWLILCGHEIPEELAALAEEVQE